jgi:hypothetical protein
MKWHFSWLCRHARRQNVIYLSFAVVQVLKEACFQITELQAWTTVPQQKQLVAEGSTDAVRIRSQVKSYVQNTGFLDFVRHPVL